MSNTSQISDQLYQELKGVMDDFWDRYFCGDLTRWSEYLDEDYKNIGSTEIEIWNNKNEILEFTTGIIDQTVGLAEIRDKQTEVIPMTPYYMVHEFGDVYIKTGDKWIMYAPFRLSSMLQKKNGKWTVLHQHGSYPDARAELGEAFAFDEIKAENKKLKDVIRSRTVELETKNRELEIESALERIRAEAMAMKASTDLLEIVVKMRSEFTRLGHEAHYFWHMKYDPEKYLKAMTSGDGTKIGMVMELPRHMHGDIPQLSAWEKSSDPLVIYSMGADAAIDYVDKMIRLGDFKQVDPNSPSADDIRHIGGLTFIMARTMHGEIGYSLPGEVPNPPTDALETLKRFADAFDLAYRRFEDLRKAELQSRQIEISFEENQRLLHSILPETIAERIRKGDSTIVKRYDQVSILFADIVGFTVLSEKSSPAKVVDILNGLFSRFDDLTDKYGIEKIKTIGDAYMVASGVPQERDDHATTIFRFAIDMLQTLEDYNRTHKSPLQLRIGISSGPVVAGVIGKKKFAYDLWGDSVNTAARMEAYGEAGCIQLSPRTFQLLKDEYSFTKISGVTIKGKGLMDVYLWRPS